MGEHAHGRVKVSDLYQNTLQAVQAQSLNLGEPISEKEFETYVSGDGPEEHAFKKEGGATNPNRPKSYHLGRVKYFFNQFRGGIPVEPILITFHPLVGWCVSDGSHRLLGAHFAKVPWIDVIVAPEAQHLLRPSTESTDY